MATIHLEPGGSYSEHSIGPSTLTRRPLVPTIRWGAVLAGVAVGVSTQLALTLLGIASGLSATDIAEGDGPGAGPLIWAGVSMLIAAFVGGYVAARMSGLKRKVDGVLHGVVSWAVTTLLFATLATQAGTSMFGTVFNNMAPAAVNAAGQAASGQGGSGMLDMLRSQLGPNVNPEALKTLQGHIQAGRRDDAVRQLTGTMGVEQGKANTIVDQALILSGSPQQASPQGKQQADRAVAMASGAAWTVFLAVAISLALGIAGGAMGAIGARRTTWSDGMQSPRTPTPRAP